MELDKTNPSSAITSFETVTFKGHVGKPANNIVYTHCIHSNKEYTIMQIIFNDSTIYSVIDREDFPKIKDYSWHYISSGYISHTVQVDTTRRGLYLHNLIMGRLGFPGKGCTESIDHINRNGLDNRKENLRLVTHTEQNLNQKQKERRVELPPELGVKSEEIPKHIWYIKANGNHGDRFGIDLKTEKIKWKTTSAKTVPLQDKLKEAKEQLQTYYKQYPYLNPQNDDTIKIIKTLTSSYNAIINLVNPTEQPTIIEQPQICTPAPIELKLVNEIIIPINDVPVPAQEPLKVLSIIPKQWKSKQIHKTIQANEENLYKAFCEEHNTVPDDWMEQWTTFVLAVKGKTFEQSEPIIKAFVEHLRRLRHNKLCAKDPLEREGRQQWPSITVVKAFLEGKLDAFKAFTEAASQESPEDPKWTKRWTEFVKTLEANRTNEETLKGLCSKFMAAQRIKKYRRAK